jgi:hypothetical protein
MGCPTLWYLRCAGNGRPLSWVSGGNGTGRPKPSPTQWQGEIIALDFDRFVKRCLPRSLAGLGYEVSCPKAAYKASSTGVMAAMT